MPARFVASAPGLILYKSPAPLLFALLLSTLALLLPGPAARAGHWQPAVSGSMSAKDTGGDRTDDMSFDLSTGLGIDTYSPVVPGAPPYFVQVLLLPGQDGALGYWSPLTGTGFDSGDSYLNVFGAMGNPGTEKSSASPTVTLTWVPDAGKDLTSDPPPKGAIYLLEQARAEAYAYGDPASFVGTATADNGLGSPAVETSSDTSQGTDKV